MAKERNPKVLGWVFPIILLTVTFWGVQTATAEVPIGKTYDKSNYQEIEDYLPLCMKNELKEGDIFIKTGKLDYELKLDDEYVEMSQKNKGKYDFDPEGLIIEKASGEIPEDIRGNPFPAFDPKDPQAPAQAMENFQNVKFREAGRLAVAQTKWVGKGGLEREVISRGKYLFFWNRHNGPIPNPSKFLFNTMTGILEPFDIRGTTSMAWGYQDTRENSAFNYLPMLRRVRRTSAAAGSDPFLGSDACTDDAYGYNGKNADMEFRSVSEKTILAPFSVNYLGNATAMPDGRFMRQFLIDIKKGYQVPGNKYATYCMTNIVWIERPVWVVEMYPKDSYYAYGTQYMYLDKDIWFCYFKEIYSRAGEYYKYVIIVISPQESPDRARWVFPDNYSQVDQKTDHATVSDLLDYGGFKYLNCPENILGPQDFTVNALYQLSK